MITIAKGKYQEWLENDNLILLQGWARDGLTDEQIAHNIGISKVTLYEWKKKYPNFSNALKKGKEVIDFAVENALLKKALSGDTTAMIFWLANRRRNKWHRNPQEDNNGNSVEDLQPLADLLGEPHE